jgi:crotonobetaine/carnitine-CoA ligase
VSGGGFIALFDAAARAEPRRVFARFGARTLTFGALDRMASALAGALANDGLKRGDRVATMLRNGPEALAVMFALAKAGLVWVPVHVQLRGEGLRYILEHCDPGFVIAEAEFAPEIARCGARAPRLLLAGGGAPGSLEALLAAESAIGDDRPADADCYAILYTSGTTGPPKGVMLTHRMLRLSGEGAALVAAARDGDVLFVWEALYHIGGAQLVVLPLIRRVTLAFTDRFSAGTFWTQVREEQATHIHFLGGILQILLKQPPSPLDRTHGVRIAWGGGCPAEIWRSFEERFGVEIRECYGMTEASSITTYNDGGKVGSVGKPVPWFEVEVRASDGSLARTGEAGQIVVHARGDAGLFPGYFRNEAATAAALRDGCLWTGDIGRLDAEGDLAFLGRMTDSVRRRGENVSAWEVERVAAAHPAVEDCAMIGVAAEVGEQEIKLFVQPRHGAEIDLATFSTWLGERLAAYQNPRYIVLVQGFERTPSQRVMKHRLPRATEGCWDRRGGQRR